MIRPILLFILAVVGLVDAVFLTLLHLFEAGCGVGVDCTAVLSSSYASPFGIPLAAIGFGVYFAFCLLIWQRRWVLLFGIASVGVAASLLLIGIQAFVIHSWCYFCLLSAALMTGIWILSGLLVKDSDASQSSAEAVSSSLVYIGLILAFGSGPVLGVVMEKAIDLADPFSSNKVAATIGSETFTLGEIDKGLGVKMISLTENQNRLRKSWIVNLLVERDVAQKGITRAELYESLSKAGGADSNTVYANYRAELEERFQVTYSLPPLPIVTVPKNPASNASLGPDHARLTLVEFSDLQCPACRQKHTLVKELHRQFPDDLKIEFRHYPLRRHPGAKVAARAAWCADRQGQFWPFVDRVFGNQEEITRSDLDQYAREMKLDLAVFSGCLDGTESETAVNRDIEIGIEIGVSHTPTFFLNGIYTRNLSASRIRKLL